MSLHARTPYATLSGTILLSYRCVTQQCTHYCLYCPFICFLKNCLYFKVHPLVGARGPQYLSPRLEGQVNKGRLKCKRWTSTYSFDLSNRNYKICKPPILNIYHHLFEIFARIFCSYFTITLFISFDLEKKNHFMSNLYPWKLFMFRKSVRKSIWIQPIVKLLSGKTISLSYLLSKVVKKLRRSYPNYRSLCYFFQVLGKNCWC